jgi:hypothetical protein
MEGADAVVIANNHPIFRTLSASVLATSLAPNGFVYDFWNNLPEGDHGHEPRLYYAVGSVRKQPQ